MNRQDSADSGVHPDHLLPGYSLGILAVDEVDAVERHLDACPMCRTEAGTLREVTGALGLAVPLAAPSPVVKDQLLARLGTASPRDHRGPARVRPPWAWAWPGVAAAALLVAAVLAQRTATLQDRMDTQQHLVATLQGTLQRQMASQSVRLAALQRALSRTMVQASPASIRMLHGTTEAVGALGTLVMSPGGSLAVLVVHNLPTARAGMAYDCWLSSSDGRRTFVGTVGVDRRGDGYMPVHAPRVLGAYTLFGVTAHAPSRMSVLQGLMTPGGPTD